MQVTQVILNDKNKASQNLQTLQAVQPDLILVHASTVGLIDSAEAAAQAANVSLQGPGQSPALLVNCVGHKLVMVWRTDVRRSRVWPAQRLDRVLLQRREQPPVSAHQLEISKPVHDGHAAGPDGRLTSAH